MEKLIYLDLLMIWSANIGIVSCKTVVLIIFKSSIVMVTSALTSLAFLFLILGSFFAFTVYLQLNITVIISRAARTWTHGVNKGVATSDLSFVLWKSLIAFTWHFQFKITEAEGTVERAVVIIVTRARMARATSATTATSCLYYYSILTTANKAKPIAAPFVKIIYHIT